MKVRVLQGLLIASSALVLMAGQRLLSKKRDRRSAPPNPCPGSAVNPSPLSGASRPNYFQITRSRGKNVRPQWLLQGFGKYQCFLFFDSWHDAMDQATFRVESLAATDRNLIQLA